MKFGDPLASYFYLGGHISTHIGMGIFSGFIYFHTKKQIDCSKFEVTDNELYYSFQDVLELFVSHCIYVILYIIAHFLDINN